MLGDFITNLGTQEKFINERYETGWDELHITASNTYDDITQASAAGFLEVNLSFP